MYIMPSGMVRLFFGLKRGWRKEFKKVLFGGLSMFKEYGRVGLLKRYTSVSVWSVVLWVESKKGGMTH